MTRFTAPADAGPARWVVAGLRGFGESVLSVVPDGFAAYVRVLHPAYRRDGPHRRPVTWAQIATANGRRGGPAMQLCALTGGHRYAEQGQPGVFDDAPSTGTLPAELVEPLTAVLGRHTGSPLRCWFAVWEGFGGLPGHVRAAPAFVAPNRRYHLLGGPLTAAAESLASFPGWQSANLCWPDDRSWCAATEIDLNSSYVGVSAAGAAELLAAPELESLRIDPGAGVAVDSDPDNPAPPH